EPDRFLEADPRRPDHSPRRRLPGGYRRLLPARGPAAARPLGRGGPCGGGEGEEGGRGMNPLVVEGLSRSFGGVQAVRNVSFALRPNELLALIGPNGAGKSTCFNMLNGQLSPDSGSIKLFGREIVGLKPRQVWRLGVGRSEERRVGEGW